jgi:cell division septal protein FtsQ
MFNKKRSRRKREFLLESNHAKKTRTKKNRNRWLNLVAKILLLNQLSRFFKKSILLFLVFFVMTSFIVFAIFSPYFKIKELDIKRTNSEIDIAAIETALKDFYGKNLLFIDKYQISQKLLDTFPTFQEIKIKEKFPSTLELEIELTRPFFTILNEETANHVVISEKGVILSLLANPNIPKIKLKNYPNILKVGDSITNPDFLQKIKQTQEVLAKEFNIQTKEIVFYLYAQEFHIISTTKTAFWFDLRRPIKDQLKLLKHVPQKIQLNSSRIEHVDLRIPNQISYK